MKSFCYVMSVAVFLLVALVAVPVQARTTVHGVAVKVVKQTARVATYPVRHPKRTVKAVVKHL